MSKIPEAAPLLGSSDEGETLYPDLAPEPNKADTGRIYWHFKNFTTVL